MLLHLFTLCKLGKHILCLGTCLRALTNFSFIPEGEHFPGCLPSLIGGTYLTSLGRAAAAIIVQITYGIQIDEKVDEEGDNYVSLADKAMSNLARAGLFGTYMVVGFCSSITLFILIFPCKDYVPALKYLPPWLPGASFKRLASQWRALTLEMLNRPFDMVKQKMVLRHPPVSDYHSSKFG